MKKMLLLLENIAISKITQLIFFCFPLIGNATNNYHLKLKESLVILKLKPSLNIAIESMPLYLFENDS